MKKTLEIRVTPRFEKSFSKLPEKIQVLAIKKQKLFAANPKSAALKTHKLKGKLGGLSSFSVNFSYRILLEFVDDETALFHDIGDHDIYK